MAGVEETGTAEKTVCGGIEETGTAEKTVCVGWP